MRLSAGRVVLPLLAVLAFGAFSGGRIHTQRSRSRMPIPTDVTMTPAYIPFFEFAPLSGAGMGTACAGTAVTGSAGEVVNFTRASDATCMKHSELSGILPGDMVTVTTDQPRVQPGGDGTGALGLGMWVTKTNTVLYPEEIDNAAWVKGVSTTVTADVALAPDGTMTADRVRTTAATGYINQLLVNSAVPYAISTYICGLKTLSDGGFAPLDGGLQSDGGVYFSVDGGDGTGSIPLCGLYNANAYGCMACVYAACPSFNRCAMYNNANVGASNYPCLGNGCVGNDGGPSDLLVWGVQEDLGAAGVIPSVSPYIHTGGTPTARATETAFVDAGTAFGANAVASFGVTVVQPNGVGTGMFAVSWYQADANRVFAATVGGTGIIRGSSIVGGVTTSVDADAGSYVFNGLDRISMLLTKNVSLNLCVNGGCVSAQLDGGAPTTRAMYIGSQLGVNQYNATLKMHCADSSPYCQTGSPQ